MIMSVELTVVISIFCTLLGAAIGVFTFIKNSKKDVATEAKNDGILASELGYIKAGVDDIKRKQEKQDEKHEAQHLEVVTRLTSVEAEAKRANLRIDRLEGKKYE